MFTSAYQVILVGTLRVILMQCSLEVRCH